MQELEGLAAILQLLALTYRALERVVPELALAPVSFDERARRVDDLLAQTEELRLAAVERAFV